MDELNRIIILPLLTDLIERSLLSICDDSWIFCLFIYASLSLLHSSTPPFRRPSASTDFLHSLTPPHYAYRISLRSAQGTTPRRRSLFMLVLTHSDTHHLNRHMVGCGCHEILIQRFITVLLLSNFSLYPIQLSFWRLSYSNHSFQLISIHYSVHHPDPLRNHQSCYQESFSSAFNRRQAHTQRHICG